MFSVFKKFFQKPVKKIAFIDGDQDVQSLLNAYTKHVANTGTETHFIRMKREEHSEPRQVKNRTDFNKIYLSGLTAKKEVVDKFIAAYIQRAISEGYHEISVISSDYDFIDIFKMAVMIDEKANNVKFRMIVPKAKGRMADTPDQMFNIQIIK